MSDEPEPADSLDPERYDRWFEQPWGRHAFTVERDALLEALGSLDGRELVELGCGTERFTAALQRSGAEVTGVDNDPGMLVRAASRADATFVLADAHTLPLSDDSFDVAVAVTLLEFAADPQRIVDELVRVTRPRGRIAVATFNPRSPWGLAHRRELRNPPSNSACPTTRRQLRGVPGRPRPPSAAWRLARPRRSPRARRAGARDRACRPVGTRHRCVPDRLARSAQASSMRGRRASLPTYDAVTVVCAHPDDESFGLGAGPDLGVRCAGELDCAARELGIDAVTMLELGLPVLGWAIPETIVATLRIDFTVPVVGRDEGEIDLTGSGRPDPATASDRLPRQPTAGQPRPTASDRAVPRHRGAAPPPDPPPHPPPQEVLT